MISVTKERYKSWVETEFSHINFDDIRLSKRFRTILKVFMGKAQENISAAFENWSEVKACYRFFSNPKVTWSKILQPHKERTLERMQSEKKILLIQDTTFIDYQGRGKTEGLDNLSHTPIKKHLVKGLILHNSFAVSGEGMPLGIFSQYFIERKELRGHEITRSTSYQKPISNKESFRWIQVIQDFNAVSNLRNVIHIADREADIYELYRDAIAMDEHFLIRARVDRSINKQSKRQPPTARLFSFFENHASQGIYKIAIQTNSDQRYRDVELRISYSSFNLGPPPNKTANKDGNSLPNLKVWGIIAREDTPPEGVERICWLLITDLPINTLKEAIEKIKWYSYRWNIELFHKILKSGCSIEKAQLRQGNNLKKYVTLKSIIAWRIFWMTRIFNRDKSDSCEKVLSKYEWEILYKRFNKGQEVKEPPKIGEIYYWIAKLGGYVNRKSDHPPGIISIWKGWTRFSSMVTDIKAICG